MFNKKKLKEEKEFYILEIALKDNEEKFQFSNGSKHMPNGFRKVLGWYSNRNSKMYIYNYYKGVLVLDRDNINFIRIYKNKK